MSTESSHLTVIRGAELRVVFAVKAPVGTTRAEETLVDLSQAGVVLEWTAKDRPDEPVPILRKTLALVPGGIIKLPGQGACLLILLPADTLQFRNAYRQLFWEMRVTTPGSPLGGGGPFTVDTGDLEVFESSSFL